MQHGTRAGFALLGLLGIAVAAAGFYCVPLGIPFLTRHQEWIYGAKAKIRGARFLGRAGVVLQTRGNDCGAACLKMILAVHRIDRSLADLTYDLKTTRRGTSLLNLRTVAGGLGLPARSWIMREVDLRSVPLPAIALVNRDHFVVLRSLISPDVLLVDDPALGRLHWPVCNFRKRWTGETLVFDAVWAPSETAAF